MKKHSVYLDHAAATPVDAGVLKAMEPYFAEKFYNPSALYLSSKSAHHDLEQARADVAKLIGAKPPEIIFTSGASEANNLAIQGIMRQYPDAEIVVPEIEHDAVWAPAGRYKRVVAKTNPNGIVGPEAVAKAITDNTVLVSVMYANNEIGTIQPLSKIAAEMAKIRKDRQKRGVKLPIYFHTDASQAGNYLDIHVPRLGVDLMTLNGGKIYGPKQSGCLFLRAGIRLLPLVDGGGQEWGLRSGTESLAQSVGFATALAKAQAIRVGEAERVSKLRDQLRKGIEDLNVGAERTGEIRSQLPNMLHVRFPGQDNERLVMELDELGVQAAAGSACKASSDEPSRTLLAIGMSADEAAETLRFSFGRLNKESDVIFVLDQLKACLKTSQSS